MREFNNIDLVKDKEQATAIENAISLVSYCQSKKSDGFRATFSTAGGKLTVMFSYEWELDDGK